MRRVVDDRPCCLCPHSRCASSPFYFLLVVVVRLNVGVCTYLQDNVGE